MEEKIEIKNIQIPVSVVQDGKFWVVFSNDETDKLIGRTLTCAAQGNSEEEAIKRFFFIIKHNYRMTERCMYKYQCYVPFRKGKWGKRGGNWFVIYGIHFYFRYGRQNKRGWFIPFTNINIMVNSEWRIYRDWKKRNELPSSESPAQRLTQRK